MSDFIQLAARLAGMLQQGGNPMQALGASSPVPAPGASSPVQQPDVDAQLKAATLEQSQLAQREMPKQIARQRAAADRAQAELGGLSGLQPPAYGPEHEGFFKTLLRATAPGQAYTQARYGPGIARYEAEVGRHAKAAELAGTMAGTETKAEEPIAALAYRPMMGLGRAEAGAAAQTSAAARAEAVRNNFTLGIQRLQQNAQALGIKADALRVLENYHSAYLRSFDKRTQALEDVGMATMGAHRDASAASDLDKFPELHPFLSMMGLTPDLVVPSGARTTPAGPAAEGPPRPVYDKNGKLIGHTRDGKTY